MCARLWFSSGVTAPSSLKLTYFDGRGLAEVSRMVSNKQFVIEGSSQQWDE
jgi:hypothetical protein